MINIILTICFCLITTLCFSAELILKIGNSTDFKDGDIIHAMNDRKILGVHAQHICHVKNFGKKANGLRQSGTLLEDYLENTMQYRFERINTTQIKRTDIELGTFEIFGEPKIYVQQYVDRRVKSPRHKMFGEKGSERWYGGDTKTTLIQINKVWDKIEAKTSNNRVDFKEFPFTDREQSGYLVITVDDMTNAEAGELEQPKMGLPIMKDGALSDNILETRKYHVDYNTSLGLTQAQKNNVSSRTKKPNIRRTKSFLRSNIIESK